MFQLLGTAKSDSARALQAFKPNDMVEQEEMHQDPAELQYDER